MAGPLMIFGDKKLIQNQLDGNNRRFRSGILVGNPAAAKKIAQAPCGHRLEYRLASAGRPNRNENNNVY
jgi:hypothetical protein